MYDNVGAGWTSTSRRRDGPSTSTAGRMQAEKLRAALSRAPVQAEVTVRPDDRAGASVNPEGKPQKHPRVVAADRCVSAEEVRAESRRVWVASPFPHVHSPVLLGHSVTWAQCNTGLEIIQPTQIPQERNIV